MRTRLNRRLAKRGWNRVEHDGKITGRVYRLTAHRFPWWDWGQRLMILVGSPFGGGHGEPQPPTWWYRRGDSSSMWRTGYPRHPIRTFEIIKGDYSEFRRQYDGLTPDEQYEWKSISPNQDGNLVLGRQYWGETFYGLDRWEAQILKRYMRAWDFRNWFGLRSWLYTHALYAAVHQRKPFTCQQAPPKDSGGYSHWHCTEKRNHSRRGLPHRFRAYTWVDIDGETVLAHMPKGETK